MHLNKHMRPASMSIFSRPLNVQRARLARCCISCSAQQIRARWCIDIRYGVKVEAVELLQEWVRDIGSKAGLNRFNTQINSGSLGIPESRLEMEIALDSLAELDAFRANIPADLHKAWSQRAQHYIVDGSPSWQVYVSCPVLPEEEPIAVSTTSVAEADFRIRPRARPDPHDLSNQAADFDAVYVAADDQPGPVDWKGDPMVINPGDKMPFNFS